MNRSKEQEGIQKKGQNYQKSKLALRPHSKATVTAAI